MKLILVIAAMLISFSLHAELSYYSSANHEMDYAPLDENMSNEEMKSVSGCEKLKDNFEIAFPLGDKSLPIASAFSQARTIGGVTEPHWGIDVNAKYGADVYAAHDGIVTEAYNDTRWGNGNHVSLKTKDGSHATAYLHLSKISVSQSSKVITAGTKIGEVGNSGYSTGVHLHFSYKVWCPAFGKFMYRNPVDRFLDYPKK
jgi:murein DD-endopeptidase MepM/ murein hydrolase activator NlpD